MTRLLVLSGLIVSGILAQTNASAQTPGAVSADPPFRGPNTIFGAPGYYGTSYGTASFGVPRLYSEFSSPYGGGYGYGYARPALAQNAFGEGLWRAGREPSTTIYGAPGAYRTFPVETWPRPAGSGPPFGEYAPFFGPEAARRRGLRAGSFLCPDPRS